MPNARTRAKLRRRANRLARRLTREVARQPAAAAGKPRRTFKAKARHGDAAEFAFQFSGFPVPFDEQRPSDMLIERTLGARAFFGPERS